MSRKPPILCCITGEHGRLVAPAALAAGVDFLQVRAKTMPVRSLLNWVTDLAHQPRHGSLLVNDRLDVALAAGADGVHLPADRASPADYRRAAARPLIVGVSCHTSEEVRRAMDEGADFVVFGPIFESPGKRDPAGLVHLERAARSRIPVLALGGVNLDNARDCLEAGAAGIAAIRLFEEATDLHETIARLREL